VAATAWASCDVKWLLHAKPLRRLAIGTDHEPEQSEIVLFGQPGKLCCVCILPLHKNRGIQECKHNHRLNVELRVCSQRKCLPSILFYILHNTH
jgi:hypothetical protein